MCHLHSWNGVGPIWVTPVALLQPIRSQPAKPQQIRQTIQVAVTQLFQGEFVRVFSATFSVSDRHVCLMYVTGPRAIAIMTLSSVKSESDLCNLVVTVIRITTTVVLYYLSSENSSPVHFALLSINLLDNKLVNSCSVTFPLYIA